MKKDVWLGISSTQKFEDMPPEHIDLVTQATLYKRNGKFYISYEESELTGLGATRTTVKADGKNITMIRTGDFPSQMTFTESECHVGLYHTFGGAMTISTRTTKVDNRIGEDGGKLVIDYSIEIDNNLAGRHHFEMTVSTDPMEC